MMVVVVVGSMKCGKCKYFYVTLSWHRSDSRVRPGIRWLGPESGPHLETSCLLALACSHLLGTKLLDPEFGSPPKATKSHQK